MSFAAVAGITVEHFVPHALHREARNWPESNCYVDLWIEVLHALGLEPRAMLSHALRVDLEGEQWTFFKPPLEDLRVLYGVRVEELQVFESLAYHVQSQLGAGRLVLAEVDAYYLPDTAGTSYASEHTKTTIAIERIDLERRSLGYFHNAGYFSLQGDDFDGVLSGGTPLAAYAEIAKLDRMVRLEERELERRARALLCRDVALRPASNPIERWVARLAEYAELVPAGDLPRFHLYAFANLRQCGAAYELAARHLRWLDRSLEPAADELDALAEAAKTALLKLARSVQRGRPLDPGPLAEVAPRWDAAFALLDAWVAQRGSEAA